MTIETKYNVGDNVWLMHENKARLLTITNIDIHILCSEVKTKYILGGKGSYSEAELFATKEELLNSL